MYYVINKDALYSRVDEEVSRVADEAYSEDGTSLYDSVLLTLRDKEIVKDFMDDAVNQLVRRAFDICKYDPDVHYHVDELGNTTDQVAYVVPRLLFYVPDLDTTMEPAITEEISKYIALYSANEIFKTRRASVVPQYADRVQAAMDRAVVLLKSRKAPNARW